MLLVAHPFWDAETKESKVMNIIKMRNESCQLGCFPTWNGYCYINSDSHVLYMVQGHLIVSIIVGCVRISC